MEPFLAALRETGVITYAAAAVPVDRSTVTRARQEDKDFAAAVLDAIEEATDKLEMEARRRAVNGVHEPVVYQGQLTPLYELDEQGRVKLEAVQRREYDAKSGQWVMREVWLPVQLRNADGTPRYLTKIVYSDPLLAMLLKGRRKDVFGERMELTGADGGPIKSEQGDDAGRAARVSALIELARRRRDAERFG